MALGREELSQAVPRKVFWVLFVLCLTPWNFCRLTEVVKDRVIFADDAEGVVTLKTVDGVEGEMSLNSRKGKKFLVYDLDEIKVSWEGTALYFLQSF